jgi:DNA-binding response OmpR family regulator
VSERVPVLLVDDDSELYQLLKEYLADEGFSLDACHDGVRGLERARGEEHALVILDLMLPELSGLDVLRELRAGSDVPVLVLTARGQDVDRIVGLELGADDYLPKPFNPRELLARMRAILRRPARTARSPMLRAADLVLDAASREVTLGGVRLDLTTTEFELLHALLRRPGQIVSREALCREVLGRAWRPFDRSLDVHVSNLRKKLGAVTDEDRIKTVRNHGYLLVVERA